MIKMVIADDEYIIRQGLASIDWMSLGIRVEGLGTNGIDTLDLVRRTRPDILLTDIRMPGMDGIELTRIIMNEMSHIKIVLLTGFAEFNFAFSALQLGVAGFVMKPANPDDIVGAVSKAKKMIEDEAKRSKEADVLKNQVKEAQLIIQNKLMQHEDVIIRNETIDKIMEYLENHYMDNITLGMLGGYIHLSPVYLSRLLKKVTGETFLDILTRIRISKSVELLKDASIKTYEASKKVGINDSKYFGQVFKKYYGMTPAKYREYLFRQK